ncbi:MAG: hypothetical protein ACK5KO_06160 [Arachnia sp.]
MTVPVAILGIAAPAVVGFMLLKWVLGGVDSSTVALGIPGILTACAAVLLVMGALSDYRDGRRVDGTGAGRVIAWVHVVPSGIGAVIATGAIVASRAEDPWGVAGVYADIVAGVIALRVYRVAHEPARARFLRNRARLDGALASLAQPDRAMVAVDIDAGLEVLRSKGLISAADAARARKARLGMLGVAMAPRSDYPALAPDDALLD